MVRDRHTPVHEADDISDPGDPLATPAFGKLFGRNPLQPSSRIASALIRSRTLAMIGAATAGRHLGGDGLTDKGANIRWHHQHHAPATAPLYQVECRDQCIDPRTRARGRHTTVGQNLGFRLT